MNFQVYLNVIMAAFMAVLTPILPILATKLVRYINTVLDLKMDEAQTAQLQTALENGAKEAYRQLTVYAGPQSNETQVWAAGMGANYVMSRIPDTLNQKGLTAEDVRAMVAARLGGLLVADPNVTITQNQEQK